MSVSEKKLIEFFDVCGRILGKEEVLKYEPFMYYQILTDCIIMIHLSDADAFSGADCHYVREKITYIRENFNNDFLEEEDGVFGGGTLSDLFQHIYYDKGEALEKIIINNDIWDWDDMNRRYNLMGHPLEADYFFKFRNEKLKQIH